MFVKSSLCCRNELLTPAVRQAKALGFADKKLMVVQPYKKIILRIWLFDDYEAHKALEEFYWKIESHISEIDSFSIRRDSSEVLLVSSSKDVKKRFNNHILRAEGGKRFIKVRVKTPEDYSVKEEENLYFLHLYTTA